LERAFLHLPVISADSLAELPGSQAAARGSLAARSAAVAQAD